MTRADARVAGSLPTTGTRRDYDAATAIVTPVRIDPDALRPVFVAAAHLGAEAPATRVDADDPAGGHIDPGRDIVPIAIPAASADDHHAFVANGGRRRADNDVGGTTVVAIQVRTDDDTSDKSTDSDSDLVAAITRANRRSQGGEGGESSSQSDNLVFHGHEVSSSLGTNLADDLFEISRDSWESDFRRWVIFYINC